MKRQSNRAAKRGTIHTRREPVSRAASFALENLEARCLLSATLDLTQTIIAPDGAAADQFGGAVATQGNLALIGAPNKTVSGVADAGEAYLVDTSSGQVLQTFTDPTLVSGDSFGSAAVFVGNSLAIAKAAGNFQGDAAIYVYDLNNLGATPLEIATPPAVGVGTQSLITDGTDLFAGTLPNLPSTAGQIERIDPSTGSVLQTYTWNTSQVNLGTNMAISGNTLYASAVDTSNTSDVQGAVVEFDISTGQVLNTLYEPAAYNVPGNSFGSALATDSNGDLFVGDSSDYNTGGDVFQFASDNTLTRTYTSPTFATSGFPDAFGSRLATNDQNQLIVSAPSEVTVNPSDATQLQYNGAVFVFDYTDGSLQATIQNPTQEFVPANSSDIPDQFGSEVAALSNGQILITNASDNNANGVDAGAAYVFAPQATNVPPTVQIDSAPTAPVYPSEPITLTFTGADANASDTLTAVVDWGDGTTTPVADARGTISLDHAYSAYGDQTVQVTISDQVGATATASTTVDVLTPTEALSDLSSQVESLDLSQGVTSSLTGELEAAITILGQNIGSDTSVSALLDAFTTGVNQWYSKGKLTLDQYNALMDEAQWIQNSLA